MDIKSYRSHQKILVAVDCIILGFDGSELKALLIKRGFEPEKGKWSFMGGVVGGEEDADDAAARVLNQLTGMRNIYMEQLHSFTDPKRDPAARVISIAYFALIKIAGYDIDLKADYEAKWFPLKSIPSLIFDHRKMLLKAKGLLRQKVASDPVAFELLPEKFTLPQLLNLYESIFEMEFDKRNFSKKILALGVLKKLNEKEKLSSRKGAFYYVFDVSKYQKLQQSTGVKFI